MEIPYYIFLIIYLIGLGVYFFISFFNVYHIVRFGFFDFSGKLNTFLYFGVVAAILFVTFLLLKDVNWFDTIPLNIGNFDAGGLFKQRIDL
ncbi:MAG: hypothetical protein ABH835_01590 [Patescibacteria group bacterium]|nr:hypothetical protein [Patescibacteria group bacterium]